MSNGDTKICSCVKYPVMYLDMDGTLLDDNNSIRAESLSAIDEYRGCGGKVGIATGRSFEQVKPFLRQIKPELPVLLYNGSAILNYDSASDRTIVLEAHPLDESIVRDVLEVARRNPAVKGIVMEQLGETVIREKKKSAGAFHKWLADVGIKWDRKDESLKPSQKYPLMKFIFLVDKTNAVALEHSLNELAKSSGGFAVKRTTPVTVEIFSNKGGKHTAIQTVLKRPDVNRRPQDMIAFGDGGNDAEMLAMAGLGVAMSNCAAATCEEADLIIGPNTGSSIGKAIRSAAIGLECYQPSSDRSSLRGYAAVVEAFLRDVYNLRCTDFGIGNGHHILTCNSADPSGKAPANLTVSLAPEQSVSPYGSDGTCGSDLSCAMTSGGYAACSGGYHFNFSIEVSKGPARLLGGHMVECEMPPRPASVLRFLLSNKDPRTDIFWTPCTW